jgi:Zn finger protein HypA/HybF involved in hydrogenase expression
MKLIINCHCGKQLVFLENKAVYTCPYCGRAYYKKWYVEGGEYKYTFDLLKKGNTNES